MSNGIVEVIAILCGARALKPTSPAFDLAQFLETSTLISKRGHALGEGHIGRGEPIEPGPFQALPIWLATHLATSEMIVQINIDPGLEAALINAEGVSSFKEILVQLINARATELGLLKTFPPAHLVESEAEKGRRALFEATPEDFRKSMKLNSPGR